MDVMKGSDNSSHQVHAISRKDIRRNRGMNSQSTRASTGSQPQHQVRGPVQQRQSGTCGYCGMQHPPRRCPAYGKLCKACNGRNHFAVVCKGGRSRKQVCQLDDGDTVTEQQCCNDSLFVGTVREAKTVTRHDKWRTVVHVQGRDIQCKLDTGAQANVLPMSEYQRIQAPPMEETQTVLCAFGKNKIYPLGTVTLECTTLKGHTDDLLFYVTEGQGMAIIGDQACEKLNLVKRIDTCMVTRSPLTMETMSSEYADVFTGVGMYERVYDMQLKSGAEGVIQGQRKIPYAVQPKLKETLEKLKAQNIIDG